MGKDKKQQIIKPGFVEKQDEMRFEDFLILFIFCPPNMLIVSKSTVYVNYEIGLLNFIFECGSVFLSGNFSF